MTDLAAGVLWLRPVEPCTVPHWTGRIAQLWFLDQVRQHDPAMVDHLSKGDGPRPYTASSLGGLGRLSRAAPQLLPDSTYWLRFTTLETDLSRLLVEAILPAAIGQIVSIGDARLVIEVAGANVNEHPWARMTTDAALVQEQTLQVGPLRRHLELRFDSPTAFHGANGNTVPFPLPDLVFGSLIDRWNAFNDVKLHPDARRFAAECVAANRYRARTRYVPIEISPNRQGAITGFTGFCRYVILRGDRYWSGLIHALAAYSFYSGIGARSVMGLGRACLIETGPSSFEESGNTEPGS